MRADVLHGLALGLAVLLTCVVINISPSVLISGSLRYLRAVTLMAQRCTLKNKSCSRGETDSCLPRESHLGVD